MQVAPLASDAVHGDADPAEMAPASPTKAKHNPSDRVPRNSSTSGFCDCTITTTMPPRRRKKGLRKKAHPKKNPERKREERKKGNEKKKEREERREIETEGKGMTLRVEFATGCVTRIRRACCRVESPVDAKAVKQK
jgi:hypothetical protein